MPAPPNEPWFAVSDERPQDATAVADVHLQAFGRPDEAAMVDAVRTAGGAVVSLVACDPSHGAIVGHVLLSPVTVDGKSEPRGLGLAPLAVVPARQRGGLGGRLTQAALQRARSLGYAFVVVLGHPAYYPRLGFVPASRFGLRYEASVPDEAFMALELVDGALAGASGVVRYLPAFATG